MDVADIQHAIEGLPSEQQTALLDWLSERDRLQWDAQIERDFSPGGAGMDLLDRVKTKVQRGESTPMAGHRREET
ncbi:MAG: hypothetical protein ABSH49_12255 [Bryobacteraceae bacterium]|jgi:hypothetical protein